MYLSLALVIIGCMGNILSFIVFIKSNKRLPKILGFEYLVVLTITNVFYLLIHFYTSTLNRLIYLLKLKSTENFIFQFYKFDTNAYVCKSLAYLKYFFRFLNVMLILSFSLERTLAIFYPLKMRIRTLNARFYIKVSFILSLIMPIYLLHLADAIPVSDANKLFLNTNNMNMISNFNLFSLRPTFQNKFCSISDTKVKYLIYFHSVTFIIILSAYMTVCVSIMAIVFKIKSKNKYQSYAYSYRSKKISNGIESNNDQIAKDKRKIVSNSKTPCSTNARLELYKPLSNTGKQILIKKKFHNTNILLSISISFILLNFPYFLVLLFSFLFSKNFTAVNEYELVRKLKIKSFLILVELLQLINFSITGFLFYCSGRTFRHHL